jgi:lipopolysaccharide export system protein LptC
MSTNAFERTIVPRQRAEIGERLARFTPRAPRRHSLLRSHVVRLLKVVMPASAAALVLLVALWQQLGSDIGARGIPRVHVKPEDLENLRMVQPRYVGVDDKGQPYTVIAEEATQQSASSSIIDMRSPKGDIQTNDGAWIAVEGNTGVYDKQSEILDLAGNVVLFHDRGYELRSDSARVYLAQGLAEGHQSVQGQGPDIELTGEAFRLEEKGQRIFLVGESRVMLFPGVGKTLRPGQPTR